MRVECVILRNYTLSSGHEIETICAKVVINVYSSYLRASVRDRSTRVKKKQSISVGKQLWKDLISGQMPSEKLFVVGIINNDYFALKNRF